MERLKSCKMRLVSLAQNESGIAAVMLALCLPLIVGVLNNLAGLYYSQGKYAAAEALLKRALAIRVKVLGPEHPHVAKSLKNHAIFVGETSL